MKKLFFVSLFVALWLNSAYADEERDETPNYLPLHDVRLKESVIVVDDSIVKLGLNMKVYDERGIETTRYALKSGQRIKVEFLKAKSGPHWVASKIYIVE